MNNQHTASRPRTLALWVLGICTLIDSGMDILGYLYFILFPNMMQESLSIMKNLPAFQGEEVNAIWEAYAAMPQWKFGLLIVAEAAIFIGALIMLWKLKQIGFHIYTIGQICYCAIVYLVLGSPFATGFSGIIWIMMLIILFGMQLRFMEPMHAKNIDDGEDSTNINLNEDKDSDNDQPLV